MGNILPGLCGDPALNELCCVFGRLFMLNTMQGYFQPVWRVGRNQFSTKCPSKAALYYYWHTIYPTLVTQVTPLGIAIFFRIFGCVFCHVLTLEEVERWLRACNPYLVLDHYKSLLQIFPNLMWSLYFNDLFGKQLKNCWYLTS